MIYEPLKVASTPVTATVSPADKPCADAVVIVATFVVNALLVTATDTAVLPVGVELRLERIHIRRACFTFCTKLMLPLNLNPDGATIVTGSVWLPMFPPELLFQVKPGTLAGSK